jgi:hypothetical protein
MAVMRANASVAIDVTRARRYERRIFKSYSPQEFQLSIVRTLALTLSGLVILTFGGGMTTESNAAADLPANYRQIIISKMRSSRTGSIFEPGTGDVSNARISQPLTKFAGITSGGTVPTVCVIWDIKSARGESLGRGMFIFAFDSGKLSRGGAIEGAVFQTLLCGDDRVFSPFPEVNTRN